MRTLYVSYDGMTDTLGQSQVIPYLAGLAAAGHEIHLLSCEKPDRLKEHETEIRELLASHRIAWHPIFYHKKPPVFSTVWDLGQLKRQALALHRAHGFEVVHCRSYIPSLVGLLLKRRHGVRFIFDMRGFWADERVDGGLWNLKNPLYKAVYRYFKAREREFLLEADQVISLTHLAKEEIMKWDLPGKERLKIEVIPCCADLSHFARGKVTKTMQTELRAKFGFSAGDFVVCYLGSIGTWYMLPEMLAFFRKLLESRANAKFFFITPDNPEAIRKAAAAAGIAADRIVVTRGTRNEVPSLLSLSNMSVFFIKPTYSKMSSSPTKLGELLSMGIPVVMNAKVGDSDWIAARYHLGEVVSRFEDAEYARVVRNIDALLGIPPEKLRSAAEEYFSLSLGVAQYCRIYSAL
ncbi:MAG: glycosyltransferase [Deltaproteobacteria bacterium]|nr:glycosyltransferase [Deltaproteobacteria bacterium]